MPYIHSDIKAISLLAGTLILQSSQTVVVCTVCDNTDPRQLGPTQFECPEHGARCTNIDSYTALFRFDNAHLKVVSAGSDFCKTIALGNHSSISTGHATLLDHMSTENYGTFATLIPLFAKTAQFAKSPFLSNL